jgi:hypothetical protein
MLRRYCGYEHGAVLATGLVLLTVLTLLGTAAVVTGVVDTKIGANYKTTVQAFYAAEAGLAEARERLRPRPRTTPIDTTQITPSWKAYLVSGTQPLDTARQQAQAVGYDPQQHHIYMSQQSALAYLVVLEPATVLPDHVLLTSYGTMQRAQRTLQAVVALPPTLVPPAALYLETTATIQGATTDITGLDRCGSAHKPAVYTPLTATQAEQPSIEQRQSPTLLGTTEIVYNGPSTDVPALIDRLRPYSNFSYTVRHATHTATTTPGPGDLWGRPTLGATPQDPSTCDVYQVVHYDTGNTSITLADGVSGCGLLLVEGNLSIAQDFSWYGLILVTGTLTLTSSLTHEQQITGAILAGGTTGTNTLGVQTHLVYCSIATNLRQLPWRLLSWKEVY